MSSCLLAHYWLPSLHALSIIVLAQTYHFESEHLSNHMRTPLYLHYHGNNTLRLQRCTSESITVRVVGVCFFPFQFDISLIIAYTIPPAMDRIIMSAMIPVMMFVLSGNTSFQVVIVVVLCCCLYSCKNGSQGGIRTLTPLQDWFLKPARLPFRHSA